MKDSLYGCLNLDEVASGHVLTATPFSEPGLILKTGNHFPKEEQAIATRPGFFMLASPGKTTRPSVFVTARNERVDITAVGETMHSDDYVTKLLLIINSEPNDLPFADLVQKRIFSQVKGSFLFCLGQTGPHSKFIFLARNVEMYMWGVANRHSSFLLWSNDADLEDQLRLEYKNKYYFYRFKPFNYGSMILQSQFLIHRYKRWKKDFQDNLYIFSALENFIRKTIRVKFVN
jgi:hypothetical protein